MTGLRMWFASILMYSSLGNRSTMWSESSSTMLGFVRESGAGVGVGGTTFGCDLGSEQPIAAASAPAPRHETNSRQDIFFTKPPRAFPGNPSGDEDRTV